MAGFNTDSLQIINLITDNLRDRYKSGFPVLKEIIQNADDAGSADEPIQLEFGLSKGIDSAEHPLLKGPALYFLNNGAFEKSDDRAIRSFAMNSKASEPSSIGKFGLGMKSVFHFCEAFFFLAKNKDQKYEEILNPWHGDEFSSFQNHNDWDNFSSSDANLIRAQVQQILNQMDLSRDSFFILWLPLRQKKHLLVNGEELGSIIAEFPGDDTHHLSFLSDQDLAQQIASLLPLLRRINSIRFWRNNDSNSIASPHFQVSLKGGTRIGFADGQYQSKDIEGSVLYQNNGKDNESYVLTYSGLEKLIHNKELLSLRNLPLWPKSYIRDDQGKSQEAPDKARGHGAVVFARSNEKKENGVLKIGWAVFLPVEAAREEVSCGGAICYRITLHGCFFIDSGRVDIEGLQDDVTHDDTTAAPQNEAELRRLWNIRLSRQGTLPLLLPALKTFIAAARLSADDIWHLTEGIQKSKLFCRHQKSICLNSFWACCLTRNGREWRLLTGDDKILPLPKPPLSAPERPWETLPVLKSFQDRGVALLLKDAPRLRGESLPQWSEENLLEVLDLQVDEVFADQGCLDYLLQFMADPDVKRSLNTGALQDRLQQIANQAFIALGTRLRQHRKQMQKFVYFILPENRYTLKSDDLPVVCELQQCKIDVLILAKEFDSTEAAGTARLNSENAFTLLKKLHNLIVCYEQQDDRDLGKPCCGIAWEILQGQGEDQRQSLLIQAEGLRILEGDDCHRNKPVALSPSDLKERHDARLLFLYSQGVNDIQRGLAPKLQKVVKEPVVLVKRETSKLVFDRDNYLVQCNANSVLDSLGAQSRPLQSVAFRRQLLPDVAVADLDSQRVRGLRYLLHGREEYFADEGTLWVSGYDQSPVWKKLCQQLARHHEDGWNLLDRKLVEKIPQDKWPKLSIREIKQDDILSELRENGTKDVTGEQLSREERDTVLKALDNDKKLWRELPFHETVNGNLVCIKTDQSFLETDISLPEELLQTVDVIKRSKEPSIERQQKDWLDHLSKEYVIRIALHYEKPEKFWRLIMDNLDDQTRLLSDPLLRDTPWMPDNDLVAVKPSDVVYLEKMQDEVNRLLTVTRGFFWSPGKLSGDLQEHQSFALLKDKSFAQDKEGFEKLAQLLGETSEYHVGNIELSKDDLERIAPIFSHLPVALGLRGWVLLACAMDTSQEMTTEFLLPKVLQPIDVELIIALLDWLQKEHNKVGKGAKKNYLTAFNAYLKALVTAESGTGIISRLTLLNRDEEWKPASELCSDAEGVADSHLLDDTQKRILQHIIVLADSQKAEEEDETTPRLRDLQPEISASADLLEDFFAEWDGLVAPEIICAFLSLLGDDPKMRALAKRYQGSRSLEWVRDNIPWKINDHTDQQGTRGWLYGLNLSDTMKNHRFIIRLSEGKMVKIRSILGAEIDVPLKSQFSSLITGGLFYEYSNGQVNNVRLTLRRPCIEDVSTAEISGFLKSSAEYLLKKAYNQQDNDMGRLWEELDRSDQLDIRIAQQLVLDHVPFYLPQLGVHKNPLLKDLLRQWDEARHKREEYYESLEKKETCDAEIRQVLGKIQELLKNDAQVQQVVLEAVRAKMGEFQYSAASIPFELFQNADDAVVELAMMKAYPKNPDEMESEILPEHVRRFIVVEEEDSLLIAHWGRPVNAVGSAGFPGKERGFQKDLQKMLVLSSSDKSDDDTVTGKFGLGFKSVLLACERPRLLSGRLATEIIAGLCPIPIPLKEKAQLHRKLQELFADRRWPGTLLELPLKDITPQDIMQPFEQLAGIMTIFSKQIRRIDIHGAPNQVWEWKPEMIPLNAEACLELGGLPLPNELNQIKLAAYFRLHDGGILLALGPDGFWVLPDELPAIWVVAPTKESKGLGFAVNCMFDVDAGRVKLAGNSQVNMQKAHHLGNAFGQALRKLFELSHTQWDELKAHLRLEEDLSAYDFWASLWKVIGEGVQHGKGSEEVNALVSQLFCGENGLGYLISREDAMPNGLWGDYRTLTRPGKIQIVLKGSLENACIFKEFAGWEFFRDFLGQPESVTTNAVYAVAKKVIPSVTEEKDQRRSVQLADVLRDFAEKEEKITAATAGKLGRLLNHDELKLEDFKKEKEPIKKALRSFLFKTKGNSFRSADEIFVSQKHKEANPDEEKRAAFAVEEHVLSHEYQGSGLDFFFACREKITIPVEKMFQWLLNAGTDHQKNHGLRYLLEGEHGEKIAEELRERGLEGTWLSELRLESVCFLGWEKPDILEILLRKLPSIEELSRLYAEPVEISYDLPEDVRQQHDPKDVLPKIHTWWVSEKETYLAEYEQRIYPSDILFNLNADDSGRIDRKSWLILFSLAHFHTIGRQRDVQHKGFIEKCIQKGWWEIFSKKNPEEHADKWMEVLEEYIDEQVDSSEYELWMNRFPAIYKFSRWLEDYKEAFLSIERAQSLSGINGILKPRTNADFQGGGVSAPPIERSLSIGACFTLRELKRKQIINANHVIPFCYVPVKRTREFCKKIGCLDLPEDGGIENSKAIHRFLCSHLGDAHAEFSNCYDIPLQVLAENPAVFSNILS